MYVCVFKLCSKQLRSSVPIHLYNRQKKKKITKISFVLLSFYISDYSEPKKDGISGACGTSGACRGLAGKLEGKK